MHTQQGCENDDGKKQVNCQLCKESQRFVNDRQLSSLHLCKPLNN